MSTRSFGKYSFDTSHEDKVFYPDAGITKGDLIDYYEKIADTMLPYVKDRPVAMKRMPDGIDGTSFFQKDEPDYFPGWIDTETVKKEGGTVTHVIANNAATLAYLANQGCITPHVWLSKRDKLNNPDRLILDLDPSGDDFKPVQQAAKFAHELFAELDLPVYVMTTGSRGLHLLVPLDRSQEFDTVREFGQAFAERLEELHPDELTTAARKNKRGDKVYLDVARNAYAQTAVPPYAVRARPDAPVATPLTWDEASSSSMKPDKYTIETIFRRLSQKGDPWDGIQRHAVSLKGLQEKLNS